MALGKKYRAMIYATVGTIHFYRKDYVPYIEGDNYGTMVEKNKILVGRLREEIKNVFDYELSDLQVAKALDAYGAEGQSIADTTAFVPKAA